MICVKLHGTTRITLKGIALYEGGVQDSSITLHRDGWTISLILPRAPLEQREGLETKAVIPTLRAMLADYRIDEDIHEPEITRYMALIWNKFAEEIGVTIAKPVNVELTDEEIDAYMPLFPNYKPSAVLKALRAVKTEIGHLDQITANHFVVEKEAGGLGYGERLSEEDVRHIAWLCLTSLGENC
jgi:hypothetical protein